VGGDNQPRWEQAKRFSQIWQECATAPLPYNPEHNLPFGQGWNVAKAGQLKSCSSFMADLPRVRMGTSLEFPYSQAGGAVVTPDKARWVGRDLAQALQKYLLEAG
jgi:hypothetical protein